MNEGQISRMAGLFKAIPIPFGSKCFVCYRIRNLTSGTLLADMECSGANVSQHLNIMRRQGIIGSRKVVNVIYNRIVYEGVG